MSYLSRRDIDDMKPDIDKIVYKVLGSSDNQILSTIEHCLYSGYDRRKTTDKLMSLVDSKRASKIYDKVEDLVEHLKSKSRKRTHEDDSRERDAKRSKSKFDQKPTPAVMTAPPIALPVEREPPKPREEVMQVERKLEPIDKANLTSNQIRQMMANAQREIEERKRALSTIKSGSKELPPPPLIIPPGIEMPKKPAVTITGLPMLTTPIPQAGPPAPTRPEDAERARKIAELQAQIKAKLSGTLAGILPPPNPDKPKPLILDSEGRTVDKSGRAVNIPTLSPTLKANIRAKKRENFKANQLSDRMGGESGEAKFFDDRIMVKPAVRNKRALRFHEPGKFQQMAERMRMKSQLEKLQNEISQIARKTGISSATKLALIAPKQELYSDEVPQMEWWDSVILMQDLNTLDANNKIAIRESAISNLIEHPTQMRPPNEPLKPVYLPVFLTKKEQKKLRRQNRREAWKEEQEKIRLGLAPPPEPKLRISNLMRVLGTEAVQDPTKIEAHVREQMAKRQKQHEEANAARKLTVDQKRDKKIRKLKEDVSLGVHVAVYRIRDLHNKQAKKFKIETNAKQLFLTGIVVLFRDCCVVVVEGGPKQQKKYKRLMINRIKWDEDSIKNADGVEISNSCALVWEGTSQRRHFGEMKFKDFPMEKMAREFFQKHQVESYWDLAYSGAVLEASEDNA